MAFNKNFISVELLGYLNKQSFLMNETVKLYIHSNNEYSINVFFLFDKNNNIINKNSNKKNIQNICGLSFDKDNSWNITYKFKIDDKFKENIYIVELESCENKFYIPFFVKHKNKNFNNLCIANTNTWAAYDDYGGGCFYRSYNDWISYYNKGINHKKIKYDTVCFARPNITINNEINYFLNNFSEFKKGIGTIVCKTKVSHLINSEIYLYYWLYVNKIDFHIFTDRDLITDDISDFKNLIIHGHPEYWSEEMYLKLLNHYKKEKTIVNLGGNAIYYKINFDLKNNTITKDGKIHSSMNYKSILNLEKDNSFYNWCMRDINYKYPHYLLNTLFDSINGNNKVKTMVVDENSWIFKNTNLKNNEEFGLKIIPLEGDKSYNDKHIVAKSPNDSYHFIVKNNGKGFVISFGSITWTHNILISKPCSQILCNIFKKIN